MKKNKWIIAVAVLTFGTTLAIAGTHEGGKHGRKGDMGRLSEKLNLTEVQKQQVADIQKSFRAANEPFFTSFRQTMKEYREAKKSGDTARADALKATLESQRTQMKQLRAEQERQIATILTPEQRTQWDAMKAERGRRHEQKRDRQ